MSTVLLFIAATVANFIISESQMSVRMDDSSRAYAAAESGIEWGKFCIQTPAPSNCPSGAYNGTFNLGTSTYSVVISADRKKVESVGTTNNVNRKLEYVVTGNQPLDVADINQSFSVSGGFVQQFDYWVGDAAGGSVGVSSSDPGASEAIYFEHTGTKIYLSAKGTNSLQPLQSKGLIDLTKPIDPTRPEDSLHNPKIDLSQAYAIRIRIEYTKGLSAKMTVALKNFSGTGSDFFCVSPILVLDLRDIGLDPSHLTKFYFSDPVGVATDTSGDGAVYKFKGSNVYFDNMSTKGMAYIITFPVTFNSTGGSSVAQRAVVSGNTLSQPTPPTKADNVFVGWYKEPGLLNLWNFTTDRVTADTTLYAKWQSSWYAGVSGVMLGKFVYYQDLTSDYAWGPTQVCGAGNTSAYPCQVGLDATFPTYAALKSPQTYPAMNFGLYPAQNACSDVGGRLPTMQELFAIYDEMASYGNNFQTSVSQTTLYWSSVQYSNLYAYNVQFMNRAQGNINKGAKLPVRCVK